MFLWRCVTGAHRHDSVVFEELVNALAPIAGKAGRRQRWSDKLHADKAYDIARKRIERNDRLGLHRWAVERTHMPGRRIQLRFATLLRTSSEEMSRGVLNPSTLLGRL